ncbi:MAG: four helix bundle protein [Chloroflexota bacterium]|nr:four helix bundle protein [Chloroflexota bacterium]
MRLVSGFVERPWTKVKKPIRSFHDLDVYQNTYEAMLAVFNHILPRLPKEEDYDLKDQLRRSSKAIPRLIAEGHSKRHQKKGFQKYLDDAMAESNETIVSLSQVRDLYYRYVDSNTCNELIDTYDKASRQLYNLSLAWTKFSQREEQRNRQTKDETSSATE